jgi:carboxypeptidase Q
MGKLFRCVTGLMALSWAGVGVAAAELTDTQTIAATVRDRAMSGQSVAWSLLSELTTDIGPRPAGSAAERAAAEWAATKLRGFGFANVSLQSFPMVAWQRGAERLELLGQRGPQLLAATALGGSPPTPAPGLEAEIVAFPSLQALQAAPPGSLTGKIALVTRKLVVTQDGTGYLAALGARSAGPTEAASRGAIAFLMRSLGTDGHRFPHTGSTRYSGETGPIPAFALGAPDADQIERRMRSGEKVKVRLFSSASFTKNAQSQNVVAEIPGKQHPQEVVLIGAHLDCWDLGTGAIDDGSGVAIVTAAAQLILEQPRRPKRTIRIVLFGSEEVTQPHNAPLGDKVYARAHAGEMPSHVLTGESDFGAGWIYSVSLPRGLADTPFAATLRELLIPIGTDISKWDAEHTGTDVKPLVDLGVPSFKLNHDGSLYFNYHHTADDTLDKIEPATLSQNVAAWAAVVWLAADTDVNFRESARP